MAKVTFPICYVVRDVDGYAEAYPTLRSMMTNAPDFTKHAVFLEVDASEVHMSDVTEDCARQWFDDCSIEDDVPAVFERFVGDLMAAARDRREDPRGECAQADAWREDRV